MSNATIIAVDRLKLRDGQWLCVATLDVTYLEAMRLPTNAICLHLLDGQRITTSGTIAWNQPLDTPANISLDLAKDFDLPVGTRIEFPA